jgi:pimeloyl-ACP methyl ester carboxylesterase
MSALGSVCERRLEARELRDGPPGELVDVGGRHMHINRTGQGTGPTVVLDAGLAGFSTDWTLVQPEVASFAHVCSYDRAGYGWSDPAPGERASDVIATELHELLHRAGVPGPYLLVGHSFGGYNVRVFADRYPDEVAGLVLVDPSHEAFPDTLPPRARRRYERFDALEGPALLLSEAFARVGLVRLMFARDWLSLLDVFDPLPTAARATMMRLRAVPSFFHTAYQEIRAFNDSGRQAGRAGGLGNRPVAVITAAGKENMGEVPLAQIGIDQQFLETLVSARSTLHAELAHSLSTNSRHIVSASSGHLVQICEPDVVVEAIRWALEQARVPLAHAS